MQSMYFEFDGIKSHDMEQMFLIQTQSGMIDSPFFGGQDIQEEWVGNRITPYDYGTKLKPIEFSITISPLEKKWTPQLRNAIGRWLVHSEYKPFQTGDDMGKIYYAKCINAENLNLIDARGYLELTFRTNSAYAWSTVYLDAFDLSTNSGMRVIELFNNSNINRKYRPIIEIELVGGETSVSLTNRNNGGAKFEFSGLRANETVSIDNENENIVSNNLTSNPFQKFNGEWLELVYGKNEIEVRGKCKIKTKMQFPILQ